jgi:hypothetical protein
MEALRRHLALENPRFVCRDVRRERELIVRVTSSAGPPATDSELEELRRIVGPEYAFLEPLYRHFNGVSLHGHGETFGLVAFPIEELSSFAQECRASFWDEESELFPFQRDGVPFATIFASGNYFACHQGKVYYSDHDGGDDALWGASLEAFFERALVDPAKFPYDAGCYTRYFDGESDRQFIPEKLLHD